MAELFSVEDVARDRLRLSRRKVYELIAAGPNGEAPELRSVKIGRSRRISDVDLDDYVARLRHNAEAS